MIRVPEVDFEDDGLSDDDLEMQVDAVREVVGHHAYELGFQRLADAVSVSCDESEIVEAATADIASLLGITLDEARLGVLAGIAAGTMIRVISSASEILWSPIIDGDQ